MAKKSMIARKNKRVRLIEKFKNKRLVLKNMLKSATTLEETMQASKKLQNLPVNSSRTRLKTRCDQCGRPRSVYRKFHLCRMCFRKHLMAGNIPGGKKASW